MAKHKTYDFLELYQHKTEMQGYVQYSTFFF